MYPTHRTLYCDHCGMESDPRSDREPYEEDEILPGGVAGQDPQDFIRLREHREKTGDRWWCMGCWTEITTPEISTYWRDTYPQPKDWPYLGYFQLDDGTSYYIRQTFSLKRCSDCKQWLQVPQSCPIVGTDRYTVLRGVAGNKIDGWFFGVLFKAGKSVDVLCPTHLNRKLEMKKKRQDYLRASLAKLEERTRRAS